MEEIYEELDEVKAELEKLKTEYRIKTEQSESLEKAHNEQLARLAEAKLQIEKQADVLWSKSEEISKVNKISEDLKSSLHEKELSLRHLSSANEKLRADSADELQKLEGKNRELGLALDEAAARNDELERNISDRTREINALRSSVLLLENKCIELQRNSLAPGELRQRDDMILKLEEEYGNVRDQLKWKTEQFTHLEEAHKKLQKQFQLSKEEWKREKTGLLDEISSLQRSLDSQTRISEGLQTQLEMSNRALAHEESRRKFMEVEISEFKLRHENVFAQCQEEESKIESLTTKRDESIAKLRNSLGKKETLAKEMEYRISHLEQENQYLGESVKELQEAQIRNAGAAFSLTKLRNKLRGLEQVHGNCSTNLKARESELNFQIEKMKGEINSYRSELKSKEKQIQELQGKLENFHSTIEVFNEEMAILLMVLKLEFSEAHLKLLDAKADVELCNQEDDKVSFLTEQLEMNNKALSKAHLNLEQEHVEVASVLKRVESVDLMEQQKILLSEELDRHKKMHKESTDCQLHLKEQLLQMENALKDDRRKFFEALEEAESELAEKIREGSQIEFELQNWKSTAERLETSLLAQVDTERTLKHEKDSLLSIVKEQDESMDDLQQQIISLKATIAAETEEMIAFIQDKESLLQISEEKDSCIDNLQKEITWLKQESIRRESEAAICARFDADKAFEEEKMRLLKVIDEKEQSIKDLQVLAMSLEQDLTSAVIFFVSEGIEKQIEMSMINEDLVNAEYQTKLAIKEKNEIIVELEKEASGLHQQMAYQEESLIRLKQEAKQLQELLEAKKTETEKLMNQFGNKQRSMEGLVKGLEYEKGVLLEDAMKLSMEREDIFVHVEEICDWISVFSCEDMELMKTLGKILHSSEEEFRPAIDLKGGVELHDSTLVTADSSASPKTKKFAGGTTDERSPLKELNH